MRPDPSPWPSSRGFLVPGRYSYTALSQYRNIGFLRVERNLHGKFSVPIAGLLSHGCIEKENGARLSATEFDTNVTIIIGVKDVAIRSSSFHTECRFHSGLELMAA